MGTRAKSTATKESTTSTWSYDKNNIVPIPDRTFEVYHQTSESSAGLILSSNFEPGVGGSCGAGIYFAATADATNHKAIRKGHILKVLIMVRPEKILEIDYCYKQALNDMERRKKKLLLVSYFRTGVEYVLTDPSLIIKIECITCKKSGPHHGHIGPHHRHTHSTSSYSKKKSGYVDWDPPPPIGLSISHSTHGYVPNRSTAAHSSITRRPTIVKSIEDPLRMTPRAYSIDTHRTPFPHITDTFASLRTCEPFVRGSSEATTSEATKMVDCSACAKAIDVSVTYCPHCGVEQCVKQDGGPIELVELFIENGTRRCLLFKDY